MLYTRMGDNVLETIIAYFEGIWHKAFLGITWGHLILALIAFFVSYFIGRTISFFVLRYLKRISEQSTDNVFDNELYCALKRPLNFLVFVSALYFFVDQLQLAGSIGATANNLINSLMIICLYWFVINLIRPFYFIFKDLEKRLTKPMVEWLVRFIKILLVFVMVASVLQLWGIQIGPIIAGLGLFSVALALGAQDLFKNLIAGIVILGERRFLVGDRVAAGGVDGTVEHIGFRSTRIRTLEKIPVYVPNAVFSDQALTNYTNRTNRQIKILFGVTYGTSQTQLQNIVAQLRQYIQGTPGLVYADKVVYVDSLAESSINILVDVDHVSADYNLFMQDKQNLIFKTMEIVAANGSDFAFPSQSLYVEKLPDGAAQFPFGPHNKADAVNTVDENLDGIQNYSENAYGMDTDNDDNDGDPAADDDS